MPHESTVNPEDPLSDSTNYRINRSNSKNVSNPNNSTLIEK